MKLILFIVSSLLLLTNVLCQFTDACTDDDVAAIFVAFNNHVDGELVFHNATYTVYDTMVNNPRVTQIPTATGGMGQQQLFNFYNRWFVPVDETPQYFTLDFPGAPVITADVARDCSCINFAILASFNHDRIIPWLLPGIQPTHRNITFYLQIRFALAKDELGNWKAEEERILWDQASVLKQAGLIDQDCSLPILGAEAALKIQNNNAIPYNGLIECPPADPLCRRDCHSRNNNNHGNKK